MHSIDASVVVDAPVALCYQTWMDFEKFPTFMRRVVSVYRSDAAGLLPAVLFHRIYISHTGGFVVLNPRVKKEPRQKVELAELGRQ